MSKRIVLLTTGSPVAMAMAQRMAAIHAELVLIVEERSPRAFKYSPISELGRKLVGDRIMNVLGRMKQPAEVRRTVRAEERMREAADRRLESWMSEQRMEAVWPSGIDVLVSRDINDEVTLGRVRAARADLLVVFGTKLLKVPLLSTAPMGAVNAHSSLLPRYRGLRSEFWQCYHNDASAVGITIHVIEPGIDTGDILFATPTDTLWPTDPYALRYLNVIADLEHYPAIVQQYLDGKAQRRPQGQCDEPTNLGKHITMEKRIELIERLGRG